MSLRSAKIEESLGGKIRKAREEAGLSIRELSDEVQAPEKYITALEEDNYDVFSAKVYALGYLRKILVALAADHYESLLKEFSAEWEVRTFRTRKEAVPLPENRGDPPFLTPRRIWFGVGALLLVSFLFFSAVRLLDFVGNPELRIDEPQNHATLEEPTILLRGKVEKESLLTVNGREITVDAKGEFNMTYDLASGLNALEFIVKNKQGKESREVRYIVVK